jgi:hypothetical protein
MIALALSRTLDVAALVVEGLATTRPEPHLKLPTPFLDHKGRLSGTRLRVAATKSPRQAHAVQYFLEVRV